MLAKSPHQNALSSSEERHTFQRDVYLKRILKEGKLESDPDVQAMLDMYDSWRADSVNEMSDPTWQENNLEYDLRSTEWILEKARGDHTYAQHVYAALCNTNWQRTEPWPILKNETWSCSWRHAGGIVADMLGEGDYIEWYCSGIQNNAYDDAEWLANATDEQLKIHKQQQSYVGEGVVTDEIRNDFLKLGWHFANSSNDV